MPAGPPPGLRSIQSIVTSPAMAIVFFCVAISAPSDVVKCRSASGSDGSAPYSSIPEPPPPWALNSPACSSSRSVSISAGLAPSRAKISRALASGAAASGLSAERHQAAPLPEQRLRFFVRHAELVPTGGGVGEAGRRRLVFATRLGHKSLCRGDGMSAEGLQAISMLSASARANAPSPAASAVLHGQGQHVSPPEASRPLDRRSRQAPGGRWRPCRRRRTPPHAAAVAQAAAVCSSSPREKAATESASVAASSARPLATRTLQVIQLRHGEQPPVGAGLQ